MHYTQHFTITPLPPEALCNFWTDPSMLCFLFFPVFLKLGPSFCSVVSCVVPPTTFFGSFMESFVSLSWALRLPFSFSSRSSGVFVFLPHELTGECSGFCSRLFLCGVCVLVSSVLRFCFSFRYFGVVPVPLCLSLFLSSPFPSSSSTHVLRSSSGVISLFGRSAPALFSSSVVWVSWLFFRVCLHHR